MPEETDAEFEARFKAELSALSPEEGEPVIAALAKLVEHINAVTRATEWPGLLRRLGIRGEPSTWNLWRAAKNAGLSKDQFGSTPASALYALLDAKATAIETAGMHRASESLDVLISSQGGRPAGTMVNGKKLKALRRSVKCSQLGLAETCKVSIDTIQRGERNGRWTDDVFDKVAAGLTEALKHNGVLVLSGDLKK